MIFVHYQLIFLWNYCPDSLLHGFNLKLFLVALLISQSINFVFGFVYFFDQKSKNSFGFSKKTIFSFFLKNNKLDYFRHVPIKELYAMEAYATRTSSIKKFKFLASAHW